MSRRAFYWILSLISATRLGLAQDNGTQNIDLKESSCRSAPDNSLLAPYIDVKTGTILTADNALNLIRTLMTTNRAGCNSDLLDRQSYVRRNFHGLANPAFDTTKAESNTNPLLSQKSFEEAVFILHVVRWADPAPQTDAQKTATAANTKTNNAPQLTVEQQRWYLIHDKQFLRPGRLLGTKTVYFIYLHLNRDEAASYISDYSFGITKTIPQNEQNLQLLASILAPGSSGAASVNKLNNWGGMQLDMWFSTADITIDSSVTDDSQPNTAIKVDNTLKIHNEPLAWWDVSAGIPLRKMSQLSFQSSSNTLVPQNVDKKSVFALLDFYLFTKQKKDLAYGNFSWFPSLVAGVPVTQQPLHQPLIGVGWGLRFAQFYFGAIVRKQVAQPATGVAPGTSVCTGWCSQFAFGLNIPVKGLQSALSNKPAAMGGNANSQEGAGTKATTGAQKAGQ